MITKFKIKKNWFFKGYQLIIKKPEREVLQFSSIENLQDHLNYLMGVR